MAAEKTAYHVLKLAYPKTTKEHLPGIPDDEDSVNVSKFSRKHDEYQLVAENVTANNSDHAVRLYAENVAADDTTLDGAGVYVAIPARSFRPTVVSVATTTTVKVGAATG